MLNELPAASIANAFLDIQSGDGSVFPKINNMKMQKLVFYSHAWWLASKNIPLIEDDVEAWPWGPVIRDLYTSFRGFGRDPIVGCRALVFKQGGDDFLNGSFVEPEPPSQKIMSFLKEIWETHKKFTGIQLSNATHATGEPWTLIYNQYGELNSKPRIPNDLIRDVFKSKLNKN